MDWIIWLSVGAAVAYMGLRVWRMLRGGEISCGGCGKGCGCEASCPSRSGDTEAGACGLRDLRQ